MASILNYATVREVSLAEWLFSYISIPVFSYTNLIWKGASEIITQFNFAASKNFTIRHLPETPVNVDYCPVIRWRSGNTIYRYKLWQTVGETLNEKLYNGEKIGANFVIEIWSTQLNVSVTNAEAITFETSIRSVPESSYLSLAPYEEVVGIEYNGQFYAADGTTALPTTGLIAYYPNENIVVDGSGDLTQWTDSIGALNLVPTSGGLITIDSNVLRGYKGVQLLYESLTANNPAAALTSMVVIMVIKQRSWSSGNNILNMYHASRPYVAGIKQGGDLNGIIVYNINDSLTSNPHLPLGVYDVVMFRQDGVNPVVASFDVGGVGSISYSVGSNYVGTTMRFGASDIELAEIVIYTNPTATIIDDVYKYLYNKFGLGVILPLTNDSNLSGGDNS